MALLGTNLKRRDFLKSTALTTAAVAAAGVAGCAPQDEGLSKTGSNAEGMTAHVAESDLAVLDESAKWVTAACWHNCGGRCLNKVLV